jgi:hypothetical protein
MYCQELCKLENNFDGLGYINISWGKNEVEDELAKLGSSQAMVPIGVFLQEVHELSISKALAKAIKAAESSLETLPSKESITESPEVMEIRSDWRTPFMIYIRTWGLLEDQIERERLCHRAGQNTIVNSDLLMAL